MLKTHTKSIQIKHSLYLSQCKLYTYYFPDQPKMLDSDACDKQELHERENKTHDQCRSHSAVDCDQIDNTSFHPP